MRAKRAKVAFSPTPRLLFPFLFFLRQSRSSSLIEVLERVFSSTRFTITAQ